MQLASPFALVVTLVIAVTPFLVNQTAAAYDRWWGRDSIQVLSFSDPGSIFFLNDGTRDVYVTDVYIRSPHLLRDSPGFDVSREIGSLVRRDAIERHTRPYDREDQTWRVIAEVGNGFDIGSFALKNPCIRLEFKSESDPSLTQMRAAMPKLASWPAEAEVRYRASGREATVRLPLTLIASANQDCVPAEVKTEPARAAAPRRNSVTTTGPVSGEPSTR